MNNNYKSLRQAIFSLILVFAIGLTGTSVFAQSSENLVRVKVNGSVNQTVNKIKKLVHKNGMMVMGSLHQGRILEMTGIHVKSETLFVGNPHVGKKLFSAVRGAGVAVPVRVNIYKAKNGNTYVAYVPPSVELSEFHNPMVNKVADMLDHKLSMMVHMLAH